MKVRSIRWRLVASYMLLTLLTAAIVGALALSLVKRYADQQEIDYLTSNANAAAQQAESLIWPVTQQGELQQLAQTSAFLGNLRVRILDDQKHVIADSGVRVGPDTFVWIVPPEQLNLSRDNQDAPFIMSIVLGRRRMPSSMGSAFGQMPPGTRYMLVQRDDGPWGRRFVFAPVSDATLQDNGTGASAQSGPNSDITSRSNRTISVPIGGADHTVGYVELSGAPNFGAATISATAQAILVAAIAASLVAGIVAFFVGRGLTAPLNSLALAASQMSGGNLSARAPVMGDDETGQVAHQFNQMAERLQESFTQVEAERDTLRRFVSDASHELRTPITALRTFNELLRNSASDDPAARTEFLAESQTQIERLEWITRNLLDLSRLDSGVASLELSDHDGGEIMLAASAAFRQIALDRHIELTVTPPDPPLTVNCDRARIEIALSNLIDNAVKFASAGTQIHVTMQQEADALIICVQDSGPGINPDDLPHIFERFYRGKSSVTRGSGLGLALVKSIVQAHGGQVTVESEPRKGSTFCIRLRPVFLA